MAVLDVEQLETLTEEELEERAYRIAQEAEQHRILSTAMFKEAAALRARAERKRQEEHEAAEKAAKRGKKKVALPYDPNDSLIAAATLATEDLGVGFTAGDLAEKLHIGRDRAVKLLLALKAKEFVTQMEADGQWRSIDPNETLVRDAAQQLGRFTDEQLGEQVGMSVAELAYYLDWLREKGMIVGAGPMYEYTKPGPERVITRHPTRRPPEKDPPAGTEAPSRGAPVYAPNHGDRGRKMSQPGQKHKMKLKDQRRATMEQAREESAARQKAKAQKDPYAAKRAKAKAKRRPTVIG